RERRAARGGYGAGEALPERPIWHHTDVRRPGPGPLPGDRGGAGHRARAAGAAGRATAPRARLGGAPQGTLGADGAAVRRLPHGRDRPGFGAGGARARGRERVTRLAVRASWLAMCAAAFLWRWLSGPGEPPGNGRAARP